MSIQRNTNGFMCDLCTLSVEQFLLAWRTSPRSYQKAKLILMGDAVVIIYLCYFKIDILL